MRPNDELAVIDWLAGLFPLVPRRGTRLAFMFTDLEGFTAHAALQGNGAALRLLRRHDALVLPAIRTHDGRIVKRLGDGLMAVFGSPAAALRAAIAIQAAAARRRPTVKLRIGIHAGGPAAAGSWSATLFASRPTAFRCAFEEPGPF